MGHTFANLEGIIGEDDCFEHDLEREIRLSDRYSLDRGNRYDVNFERLEIEDAIDQFRKSPPKTREADYSVNHHLDEVRDAINQIQDMHEDQIGYRAPHDE